MRVSAEESQDQTHRSGRVMVAAQVKLGAVMGQKGEVIEVQI